MKKILKKAELVNTILNSVVVTMLIEKSTKHYKFYMTETYLYNIQGDEIAKSKKVYTNYTTAEKKYSSLISMLN